MLGDVQNLGLQNLARVEEMCYLKSETCKTWMSLIKYCSILITAVPEYDKLFASLTNY